MTKEILIGNSQIKLNREKLKNGEIRCITTGMIGSGKTYLTKQIVKSLVEDDSGQVIIIDFTGEYCQLRESNDKFVIFGNVYPFTSDFIFETYKIDSLFNSIKVNRDRHFVIDLSILHRDSGKQVFKELIKLICESRDWEKPRYIIIEELDYVSPRNPIRDLDKDCNTAVKMLQSLGRMRGISTFFGSSKLKNLPKDVISECNTCLIGNCAELDSELTASYLEVSKKLIVAIKNYEFLADGHGFDLKSPVLIDNRKKSEDNEKITLKREVEEVKQEVYNEILEKLLKECEKTKNSILENLKNTPVYPPYPYPYPYFIPNNPLQDPPWSPYWNKTYCTDRTHPVITGNNWRA